MKKIIFSLVAVFALASCNHDAEVYTLNPQAKAVNDYNEAFVKAFGTVGSNVDWGFGSTKASTRALGDYDGYKGNWSSSFNFPVDCDGSKFLDKVPEGVQKMPADGEVKGGTYYIDNTTTKVNMNTGTGIIYVDGTVDLSSDNCFEITQNTEIYLVKGSKFIIGEGDANKLKAIIYIESTATFETAKRLKMDNTSKVYNHGTINAGAFEVNNTSFLYNVGTLNAPNGLVYVANEGSSIVNDGTIIAGDVEVAGSGHIQNNAEWTVNGTTTVNSNSASWVNNGHWTTNYYEYTAGSENVINNCFLEVKEDFDINLGDGGGTKGFKIDAGGGVLTKNFNGGKNGTQLSGPYRILMGSNAVFKVTGTAALAAGNVGTWQGGPTYGYGIYGVGDDYAVFQATHIVKGQPNVPGDKKVQYGGKLYVSAEDHFASELDAWNQVVTFSLGFTKENIFTTDAEDEYSTGKPNITIKKTPCNPGFEGMSKPTYRVIAEDLNAEEASDFDFNDVVFDVEPNEAGNAAKIVVRAAGGIYKLTVAGQEVHKALGGNVKADGTYPMINTNPWNPEVKATLFESYSGDFSSDASIKTTIKNIEIRVYKPGFESTGIELTAKTGEPACKILVDQTFNVVTERTGIADINTNFHKYVEGTWDTNVNGFWWKKN